MLRPSAFRYAQVMSALAMRMTYAEYLVFQEASETKHES